MYGFSDHLNGMPDTLFSALLHGSSRYSTVVVDIGRIIEQAFYSGAAAAWTKSSPRAFAKTDR